MFSSFAADGKPILVAQVHKLLRTGDKLWHSLRDESVIPMLERHRETREAEDQRLAHADDRTVSTWLLVTKQGTVAILQVEYRNEIKTEFSGNQPGFNVRYRIVAANSDEGLEQF